MKRYKGKTMKVKINMPKSVWGKIVKLKYLKKLLF